MLLREELPSAKRGSTTWARSPRHPGRPGLLFQSTSNQKIYAYMHWHNETDQPFEWSYARSPGRKNMFKLLESGVQGSCGDARPSRLNNTTCTSRMVCLSHRSRAEGKTDEQEDRYRYGASR